MTKRYTAYVEYTLAVQFEAPEGLSKDDLIDAAYAEAYMIMERDPAKACKEMYSEEDPEILEGWWD